MKSILFPIYLLTSIISFSQKETIFKKINDTIQPREITETLLTKHNWYFQPYDDCHSDIKFQASGIGRDYNCEMDLNSEINYLISGDTVIVHQFNVLDLEDNKNLTYKYRTDKYFFNGIALILIDSEIFNRIGAGQKAKIGMVIKYRMK